jgi:hypothetical protein
MSTQPSSTILTALVAALLLLGMPQAEAKQQCSAAMPSSSNGKWWSYRIIDGRKCWYEGKPGLSKNLLGWSEKTSADALPKAEPRLSRKEFVDAVSAKRRDPLDARAWAPKDAVPPWAPEEAVQARTSNFTPETFDALWSSRIWLLDR